MERLLLLYDEMPRSARWSAWTVLAGLVYLAGHLLVVSPLLDRAERARNEAERATARLEEARRRLASGTPDPEAARARLEELAATLRAGAGDIPTGLTSGLLTELSAMVERSGGEAPIFNPVNVRRSPPPLRSLRIVTLEGEFRAGTRAVARFLDELRDLPVPLVIDSLALRRERPANSAFVRLHVLAAEEDAGADE